MLFLRFLESALLLRDDAFRAIHTWPDGTALALAVVALAGLSTAIGQSVVLFVNQIRPRRFAFTLLLSSGFYLIGFLVWSLSIWGVAHLLLGAEAPYPRAARAVGLGYAPQLFSFLAFMPLLGAALTALLSLWSLLAILVAVQVALDLSLWQALAATGGGWLALQLLQRTVGFPVTRFARWLKARGAGVDEVKDQVDPEAFVEGAEALLRNRVAARAGGAAAPRPSSPLAPAAPVEDEA